MMIAVALDAPTASRPAQMNAPRSTAQMNAATPWSMLGRWKRGTARDPSDSGGGEAGPGKFAEPVALSSTTPAGFPLARTALGCGFDLLALRARRNRQPRERPCPAQGGVDGSRAKCDVCRDTSTAAAADCGGPVDEESAWPLVESWIAEAKNDARVLAGDRRRGEEALRLLQVTPRSALGAIAIETGGLLVDHGWVRVLGGDGLVRWNALGGADAVEPLEDALVVAYDAIGGFYALNGGAFPGSRAPSSSSLPTRSSGRT